MPSCNCSRTLYPSQPIGTVAPGSRNPERGESRALPETAAPRGKAMVFYVQTVDELFRSRPSSQFSRGRLRGRPGRYLNSATGTRLCGMDFPRTPRVVQTWCALLKFRELEKTTATTTSVRSHATGQSAGVEIGTI